MAKHPLVLLPSITVVDGQARLAPSGFDADAAADIVTGTLAHAVASWVAQGASWIHVVDVDARSGADREPGFAVASGAHLQYEAAVRDDASLAAALATGASRLVIDPTDLDWATEAFAHHGERLAAGIDVQHPELVELARALDRAGCRRLVVSNPPEAHWKRGRPLLEELCRSTGLQILTVGGVTHLSDLHLLHEFVPEGLEGIVIDQGLEEGEFTYSEAVAASADRFDLLYWDSPS